MSNAPITGSHIPLKEVTQIPVDRLTLDRHNPRLTTGDENASDKQVIAQLYSAEDLGELLVSIAANGYLNIEPLIVLQDSGHLIVLEGNRRLAAIRLFREPDLADRIKKQERLQITLPEVPAKHQTTLDQVSVYRVANREDARSFIGFKHINGAAKWNSYAKTKFVADWYRIGETSLSDIADSIGDRHNTIKRMVFAFYVFKQGQSKTEFDIDDRVSPRFNFSHLYTALSRSSYMQILGFDDWSKINPKPNPVPIEKIDRLLEVLRWIYGSRKEDIEPVVGSQNPDIKRLGDVLASVEGLTTLRATGSLTDAYASTRPASSRFSESLFRARAELREASNSLRGFDGQEVPLLYVAEDICEQAQTIRDRMQKKAKKADTGSD